MAVSDVEAVLEFLRRNGFSDSESALLEDIMEKSQVGSFDFERFLFPMVPPPPPLKIPANRVSPLGGGGNSSSGSSEEEFVSLGSSTSELCSSDFTNPYGTRTATALSSRGSSDRLSQFDTARDYHDFDMQNDLYWYRENDEDFAMPMYFEGSDSIVGPSEDKFVMNEETSQFHDDQFSLKYAPEGLQCEHSDEQCHFISRDGVVEEVVKSHYHTDEKVGLERKLEKDQDCWTANSRSSQICVGCSNKGEIDGEDPADVGLVFKQTDFNDVQCWPFKETASKSRSSHDWIGDSKSTPDFCNGIIHEDYYFNEKENHVAKDETVSADSREPDAVADEEGKAASDELLMYDSTEHDYEIFNLRIIHRKNRTGFEENKDFPIVLNSIIAGRYYVTEYLGSAAFSKVIQAHDLLTGTDVCLKIIKNDKDFFDQSLDEIKLLKFVNKHDPGDEYHILRLYDYFYHQEHLFIVCELLRANLYEFQKYNQESGGEPYFTMSRLQIIARQCLEALEYLHSLGIIHCDLKPENILIKSYRRCEIKVIDLGSSCFQTDSLSLYVQSRSYRAPEVMLGLPYEPKIDLWSLGCILAELCSGEVLFPNEAIVMLLARMISLLGPIDMSMLLKGQDTHKYFTKDFDLYHINEETNQIEYIIPEEASLDHQLQVSDPDFIDFLRKLLEINPKRRPTAKEALNHAWLSRSYEPTLC